jgi:hypothetical protein
MTARLLGSIYLPKGAGTGVGRYSFIVDSATAPDVEVGTIVTADTREGAVVGAVVDMRTVGTDDDPVLVDAARIPGAPLGHMQEVILADVQVFSSSLARPVTAGTVRPATVPEIAAATGQDKMTWPIPIGAAELLSDVPDQPHVTAACVDGVFMFGEEGGGLAVAGRSGLASKSSFVSLVLRSAIQHRPPSGGVGALIFNVKGTDYIALDEEPDAPLLQEDLDIYAALDVPATPFEDVTVWSPCLPGVHEVRSPRSDASALRWDLRMVWPHLRFFFPNLYDDDKLLGFVSQFGDLLLNSRDTDERVDTFDKLDAWFDREITLADEESRDTIWRGRVHIATARRLRRMFSGLLARGSGLLVAGEAGHRADISVEGWTHGQIVVVDIAGLPSDVQAFVVGRTVDRVMRAAENDTLGALEGYRIAVVVDEANQYAPSTGSEMASVRKSVERVATQGRYAGAGLVLIGQMLSKVSETAHANCGTRAVGNSPDSELSSGVLGRLPSGLQERIATLPKGRMLVSHPTYRQPMLLRFPRPAWRMGMGAVRGRRRDGAGASVASVLSEKATSRLMEGIPAEIAAEVAATANGAADVVAKLSAIRVPDMTKVAVHEQSGFDPDDPFALD